MKRILFLLIFVFSNAASSAERPNFLLILCDDLGFSDIGCYGGEIRTPNLDQLAAEGMRFSQFYNCAVCVTTRASLYTGLYPRLGGKGKLSIGGLLQPNMVTLGSVLQQAGYQTAMTGKWHLGNQSPKRPIDRGFGEFYGLLDGCSSFFNPIKPDPDFYNGGRVRTFAHNDQLITDVPDDFYATDAYTQHAVKTIQRFAKSDKPFFINLNYTAPHFPLHALPEDIERYRGKYSDGYEPLRRRRYKKLLALGLLAPDSSALSKVDLKSGDYRYDYEVTPWKDLDDLTRAREEARMEVYAAMVDRLDQGIGKVLEALEKSGQANNTVVFFLSDNGGCASWPTAKKEPGFLEYNKGIPVGDPSGYEFVGKAWGWAQNSPFRKHKVWPYEGGICTPMIVRWPGTVKPNTITHQPAHLIDFMPTLLELAQGTYPTEFDGKSVPEQEGLSMTPILRGEKRKPHDFLAWSLYGNHAYREGDWKMVWNTSPKPKDRKWELYDLSRDRSETTDLAQQHPKQVKEMTDRWQEWALKVGAENRP